MSCNVVVLNGRLPKFPANYKKGEGDKKSFLTWCVSVKRDYKKPGEQYYPEDLLKFKAFGPKADFIMNNFQEGDGIIITGKLQTEEDYEKDGQTVRGGMVVSVDSAQFADAKVSEGKSNNGTSTPSAPGLPGGAPSKPGIPGVPGTKPSIPGVGGLPKPPAGKPTFGGKPPVLPGR